MSKHCVTIHKSHSSLPKSMGRWLMRAPTGEDSARDPDLHPGLQDCETIDEVVVWFKSEMLANEYCTTELEEFGCDSWVLKYWID